MKKSITRILFVVVSVAAVFLLSGCKANLITKINNDGSGLFTQEIGFTAEEVSTLSGLGSGGDLCTSTVTQMNDLPNNPEMRQETRGDETWCIFEVPFATLEDLITIYKSSDTSINDISLVDGKLHYDITMDLSNETSMTAPIQMKWILTMPGKVSNHNADEVSGSTLTWNLPTGQAVNMYADSSTGGLFSNTYILIGIGLLCLCILMVLVIGGVVFFVVSRNKKKQSPVA
jgi:hypothetical protein